jgi:hypothetical protein
MQVIAYSEACRDFLKIFDIAVKEEAVIAKEDGIVSSKV